MKHLRKCKCTDKSEVTKEPFEEFQSKFRKKTEVEVEKSASCDGFCELNFDAVKCAIRSKMSMSKGYVQGVREEGLPGEECGYDPG